MKKNIDNNEIDLGIVLKAIFQQKILITIIFLISIITAFTYSASIEKKFSTNVVINDPDFIIFNKINKAFEGYQKEDLFTMMNLNQSITNKILSRDTLLLFLDSKKNLKLS